MIENLQDIPLYIQITREDLHKRVWEIPMAKLCKEFGISDKGLAKICIKHNIPKPEPGYWRRLERGFSVNKIALPIQERPSIITIRRHPVQGAPKCEKKVEINIPDRLTNPHHLIKTFRDGQRGSSPLFNAQSQAKRLWFRCGPAHLSRVLRILDATFKELESREYQINLSQKGNPVASREGEDVEFKLDEISSFPGQLALRIESYGRGLRQTWRDGKRQRIENMLSDFFYNVDLLSVQMKQRSEERAREKIEWEHRQEQRRIQEQREELLLKELERFERIERIKKYVEALRNGSIKFPAELDIWIPWVEKYMQNLSSEPLTRGY